MNADLSATPDDIYEPVEAIYEPVDDRYESLGDIDADGWPMPESIDDVPDAATPEDFELVCLADVEPEQIEWLWPERIPLGKLSIWPPT
jgi:hypothetical protein